MNTHTELKTIKLNGTAGALRFLREYRSFMTPKAALLGGSPALWTIKTHALRNWKKGLCAFTRAAIMTYTARASDMFFKCATR